MLYKVGFTYESRRNRVTEGFQTSLRSVVRHKTVELVGVGVHLTHVHYDSYIS